MRSSGLRLEARSGKENPGQPRRNVLKGIDLYIQRRLTCLLLLPPAVVLKYHQLGRVCSVTELISVIETNPQSSETVACAAFIPHCAALYRLNTLSLNLHRLECLDSIRNCLRSTEHPRF